MVDKISTPPAPPIDLAAENATLKAKVAELELAKVQSAEEEKVIAAKIAKGLSRAQAIAVIRRQREYDASPIAQERGARGLVRFRSPRAPFLLRQSQLANSFSGFGRPCDWQSGRSVISCWRPAFPFQPSYDRPRQITKLPGRDSGANCRFA